MPAKQPKNQPPALVVGACSHGLATIRALARKGVHVYALESNKNLPGTRTKFARMLFTADINGPSLIDALVAAHNTINSPLKPVLFLMNDNMVIEVAKNWERLAPFYQLSWADCRATILKLIYKTNLESVCREQGAHYPQTHYINSIDDLSRIKETLTFPVIVKPEKPLGQFKALNLDSYEQLTEIIRHHSKNSVFLVQQLIPGPDSKIMFYAFYLENGVIKESYGGRKLKSHPPCLGQTTMAEPYMNEAVYEATKRFFKGLGISGPCSLELKQDTAGKLWVIEPTIGRTDFWVGNCIANNVNFPYIEYCSVVHRKMDDGESAQKGSYCWYDTERDPKCFLQHAFKKGLLTQSRQATFPFAAWDDLKPFFFSIIQAIRSRLKQRNS